MTVHYTWLTYHGVALDSQMAEVRYRIGDRNIISVHNYLNLCRDHQGERSCRYILSRFTRVINHITSNNDRQKIQAEFEDVSGRTAQGKSLFCVTFMKRAASELNTFVNDKRLVPGDLVSFVHATVLQNHDRALSLMVDNGTFPKPAVTVWRQYSQLYLTSFLLDSSWDYQHFDFYRYDTTGCKSQEIDILLKLVEKKGKVTSMVNIANENRSNQFVALLKYKGVACPLKYDHGKPTMQLFLEEVSLLPRGRTRSAASLFYKYFKATFSDSKAVELSQSIKVNLLEIGDFMALSQFCFEKPEADKPIDIYFFSRLTDLCIIVLKTRFKEKDRFELCKYQTPLCDLDSQGVSVSRLNEEIDLNCECFDILLFKNLIRMEDILDTYIIELEKSGNILNLNDCVDTQMTENSNNVILSTFLNIVIPVKVVSDRKRAVFLFRELKRDGTYGSFFKLLLFDTFARILSVAIFKKHVIQGDVVALYNPCVMPNPASLSLAIKEEPFIVEMMPSKYNQKIIACKVNRTDGNTLVTHSQTLSGSCIQCPQRCIESNEDVSSQAGSSNVNSNASANTVHNIYSEQKSTVVTGSTEPKVVTGSTESTGVTGSTEPKVVTGSTESTVVTSSTEPKVVTALTKPTVVTGATASLEDKIELNINIEDLFVFPFGVVNPNTGSDIDFISGYCYGCKIRFVCSVMKRNAKNEPLCPKCLSLLKLRLCLELTCLMKNGRHIRALLEGPHAERFLRTSSSDFINNLEKREAVLNALRMRIPDSYSQYRRLQRHYKLSLTKVTRWWYS